MKNNKRKNKGVTLVALVVTIIILLILVGISISALTQTGIFGKTKDAEKRSKEAEQKQAETLGSYEKEINKYVAEELTSEKINKVLNTNENTVLKDSKGNVFTVPAGFKITEDAITVDKGIVIENATDKATQGSQFVWIPVGEITKADGTTTTINLDRYTFDGNGTPTAQGDKGIKVASANSDFQELETSDKGNTVAKSITEFKKSVATNGGYYIGRYEARQKDGQITEVKDDTVWNNINQPGAAKKAQEMYTSDKFTSDLMNSYAWDTAILFVQKCANIPYSRQNSLNATFLSTGTENDVQCNIYDMASNVLEWTTETAINSSSPCVRRGGDYEYNMYDYTSIRGSHGFSSFKRIGFRPLLFM